MSNRFRFQNRQAYLGYVLWVLLPFLAFSFVTNKLLWYVYPALVGLLSAAGIALGELFENKEISKTVRLGLLLLAFGFVVNFTAQELTMIKQQTGNDFQNLVHKVALKQDLKGCEVYVDYDEQNANWSQQDVFVAEAYGDFSCINGGMMAILAKDNLEEKNRILFVGQDVFEKNEPLYANYELLEKDDFYRAYRIGY